MKIIKSWYFGFSVIYPIVRSAGNAEHNRKRSYIDR